MLRHYRCGSIAPLTRRCAPTSPRRGEVNRCQACHLREPGLHSLDLVVRRAHHEAFGNLVWLRSMKPETVRDGGRTFTMHRGPSRQLRANGHNCPGANKGTLP